MSITDIIDSLCYDDNALYNALLLNNKSIEIYNYDLFKLNLQCDCDFKHIIELNLSVKNGNTSKNINYVDNKYFNYVVPHINDICTICYKNNGNVATLINCEVIGYENTKCNFATYLPIPQIIVKLNDDIDDCLNGYLLSDNKISGIIIRYVKEYKMARIIPIYIIEQLITKSLQSSIKSIIMDYDIKNIETDEGNINAIEITKLPKNCKNIKKNMLITSINNNIFDNNGMIRLKNYNIIMCAETFIAVCCDETIFLDFINMENEEVEIKQIETNLHDIETRNRVNTHYAPIFNIDGFKICELSDFSINLIYETYGYLPENIENEIKNKYTPRKKKYIILLDYDKDKHNSLNINKELPNLIKINDKLIKGINDFPNIINSLTFNFSNQQINFQVHP